MRFDNALALANHVKKVIHTCSNQNFLWIFQSIFSIYKLWF